MNKQEALKKIEDLKRFVEELDKKEVMSVGYITTAGKMIKWNEKQPLSHKMELIYSTGRCDFYSDGDTFAEFIFVVPNDVREDN